MNFKALCQLRGVQCQGARADLMMRISNLLQACGRTLGLAVVQERWLGKLEMRLWLRLLLLCIRHS
jgi:hypothetical protein